MEPIVHLFEKAKQGKGSEYQNPEIGWPPGQYLLAMYDATGEYVRFYPAQISLPAGYTLKLIDLPIWYHALPRLADILRHEDD